MYHLHRIHSPLFSPYVPSFCRSKRLKETRVIWSLRSAQGFADGSSLENCLLCTCIFHLFFFGFFAPLSVFLSPPTDFIVYDLYLLMYQDIKIMLTL